MFYFHDLNVCFCGCNVRRNFILVTLRGQQNLLCFYNLITPPVRWDLGNIVKFAEKSSWVSLFTKIFTSYFFDVMKVFINKSDKCAITITNEIIDGTHNKIKCICPAYVFIMLSSLEIVFLISTTFPSLCPWNIAISFFR